MKQQNCQKCGKSVNSNNLWPITIVVENTQVDLDVCYHCFQKQEIYTST